MAPSTANGGGGRRRIGRTLRRARGATSAATGPLKVIEENTVIDLSQSRAQHATSSHFSQSPPVKTAGKRKREASTAHEPAGESQNKRAAGKKAPSKTAKAVASTAADELDRKLQRARQLVDDLEKQLEKRCADLVADAERKAEELRMELKVQLMFLPESVRAMAWKTFIEDFGGSLDNVIQNVKEQDYINYVTSQQGLAAVTSPTSALKIRPAPSTVRSKDRRSHGGSAGRGMALPIGLTTPNASTFRMSSTFQTPLSTPMSAGVPKTIVRTARKGERTYSVHGSPIAPDSVVKAPVGSLVATFQEDETGVEPMTCITLDNETAVDLSNPDQLNDETRAQARAKLEALQAKVNALLRQLK
ncbi:hypothetical protein P43SY_009012 [Pythium insidiosum]|uniref:Borealin N-terminal domain-containing protein n=1 Tax=Pythium insidiosum TaxID=114742 RepID=A0AAD5LJX7_PYTIN|nr:hypothetical protein P43SY_009012 [Pythium insidiosum]